MDSQNTFDENDFCCHFQDFILDAKTTGGRGLVRHSWWLWIWDASRWRCWQRELRWRERWEARQGQRCGLRRIPPTVMSSGLYVQPRRICLSVSNPCCWIPVCCHLQPLKIAGGPELVHSELPGKRFLNLVWLVLNESFDAPFLILLSFSRGIHTFTNQTALVQD